MEEKSNVFKYLFIVFLILTCVLGGFLVYDKFIKETDNNIDNSANPSNSGKFTFNDFVKLMENNNHDELIAPTGDYSAILEFYLKNNQVYASFRSIEDLERMGIQKDDIDKIKSLKLDKDNQYKLPLQDIILVDAVKVGQDGSSIIFFEDRNGKVYSFHASQTGAFNYPLFNQDGDINIEEESKLKNIVKFGSYPKNDSIYFFGIDINGKLINEL